MVNMWSELIVVDLATIFIIKIFSVSLPDSLDFSGSIIFCSKCPDSFVKHVRLLDSKFYTFVMTKNIILKMPENKLMGSDFPLSI